MIAKNSEWKIVGNRIEEPMRSESGGYLGARIVCEVPDYAFNGLSDDEQKSRMALLLAAPEMLKALKLVAMYSRINHAVSKDYGEIVVGAIAKAERDE